MRKTLLIAVSFLSACPAFAAEKSNFTFDVAYRPHAVGFRVVQQYDYSRAYKRSVDAEGKPETRERARPIQTLIWYPAEPDRNSRAMLYGSYVDLLATEDDFTLDDAQRASKLKTILERFGLMDNYERERAQVTRAFRDARPKPGHFPVVIYAPSFSASAFENSDLCEYLASHGLAFARHDSGPGRNRDASGRHRVLDRLPAENSGGRCFADRGRRIQLGRDFKCFRAHKRRSHFSRRKPGRYDSLCAGSNQRSEICESQ
jgi:hypothetical protein